MTQANHTMTRADYTINVRGMLLDFAEPRVMGILNATPDSFFAGSRQQTERDIARRAVQIVEEGGTIVDVGACSTRPGGDIVSEAEEMERLKTALPIVRRECPDAILSVDTFRPDVARMTVEDYGVDIVNDVSGGSDEMFDVLARLSVPYVLCSTKATVYDLLIDCAAKVQALRDRGVKDIILDPGFGFGKTLDDNFAVMGDLERLHVLGLPLLVGISRKSMIHKMLGCTPDDSLNGTTALHAVALMKGASLLRVHDVREAVECVRLLSRV